jgi:Tfp pilus assembly protein PilO
LRSGGSIWSRRVAGLALSGLLLAGNLAFFLWYRSTARQREQALEARRSALHREVEAAETEAARLGRQREHLSQVSAALDEFYGKRVGPGRDTLAPLVDELHSVLRRVGVAPAQISYSSVVLKDLSLTELNIFFGFKNDYARFKQLVAALETSRRWLVVRGVALSRDMEAPGGIQVQMHVSAYFVGEEKPAVVAAAVPRLARP